MKELNWCQSQQNKSSIIKVPLHFLYPPIQTLSKQLTKLNSNHEYRIVYLGPRWQNSAVFHKKYSNQNTYKFDLKRVSNNNNSLNDTMNQNQFYRNQIYYRAFEGMNPTLKQQLTFESRFQSGNLDCVVKVNQFQYDLFLRIDSNTRGHINWFYFSVKSPRKTKIKLNICNMTKGYTHFSKQGSASFSFQPTNSKMESIENNQRDFLTEKTKVQFLKILNLGLLYQLSFQIDLEENQQIKLAYNIPYTYSNLLADIKLIAKEAEVEILGQSLTGIDIPLVCFGKFTTEKSKPVIVVTGRVHPAQTNGSWILSSFMRQLSFSEEMRYLREEFLIVIIPMLNPDGVILGNSRTGAAGKDLNRQFKTKNHSIFPEITNLKRLIKTIQQTHIVDFYFDFHGHSCRKNIFMFGPNYSISQSEYYKCRIFPRILSQVTPIFRYYGCSYHISAQKKGTARAIMLNQMSIPYVYTVQTSLGFFDERQRKGIPFDKQKLEQIGTLFLIAFLEYQKSLQQLRQYRNIKDKNKKPEQIQNFIKSNMKQSKKQAFKKIPKMLKFYEAILAQQNKKNKELKKQKQSEGESDSHDQKEDLQKQKMGEFVQMVSQFVQIQRRKKEFQFGERKKITQKNKNQQIKNKYKLLLESKIQKNNYFEDFVFDSIDVDNKQCKKRSEMRTQNKLRNKDQSKSKKKDLRIHRSQVFSHLGKKQSQGSVTPKSIENSDIKLNKSEKEDQYDGYTIKPQKLNVRMFNFSKMVQSPERKKGFEQHVPFTLKKHMMINKIQKRHLEVKKKQRITSIYQKNIKQMQSIQTDLNEKIHYSQKCLDDIFNFNSFNSEEIIKGDASKQAQHFYRIKQFQLQKKRQFKNKMQTQLEPQNRNKIMPKSSHSLDNSINLSNSSKYNKKQQRQTRNYAKIHQFPIL